MLLMFVCVVCSYMNVMSYIFCPLHFDFIARLVSALQYSH